MAELDAETLERAVRWCAEAGRWVTPAEVARALAPLSWDELLAAKALLADPPPARPLGPLALADVARGAPADVAAEREREGRYRPEEDRGDRAPPPPPRKRPAAGARRPPAPVIRRARDRSSPAAPHAPPAPPARASLDELRRPEGRAVLERILRRIGARRPAVASEIAAGFSRPDGGSPGEDDVHALLAHHGLLRVFEHREREEILHALRAAGGVRAAAAARLSTDVAALGSAIDRLGAGPEVERIREERRADLRGRATLAERVRLLLADGARLADFGILEEFERDLRSRLPEHVRALRAGAEPLPAALRKSLGLSREALDELVSRFALDLGGGPARPRGRKASPASKVRPGPRRAPGGRAPPSRPPRGRKRPPRRG